MRALSDNLFFIETSKLLIHRKINEDSHRFNRKVMQWNRKKIKNFLFASYLIEAKESGREKEKEEKKFFCG